MKTLTEEEERIESKKLDKYLTEEAKEFLEVMKDKKIQRFYFEQCYLPLECVYGCKLWKNKEFKRDTQFIIDKLKRYNFSLFMGWLSWHMESTHGLYPYVTAKILNNIKGRQSGDSGAS